MRTERHVPPPPTEQRLGDVAQVFAGIGVSREDSVEHPGDKLPVIGVRNLLDGTVSARSELDTVAFADPDRAKTYAVREDDVLLTGRGTLLKFGIVGDETAGAIASGNIIVVRPGAGAVGGALYAILSSDVFRPRIELLRRGATTLLSLSPKDLPRLEIALPTLDEQRRIAAVVHGTHSAYRTAIEAANIRRALARRLIDLRLFGAQPEHR
jgi:restriction endonuclease S subunit